ncbi:hypothetical protein T09_3854 [Trichinella sp. T9]|nr:hypothetical protein T09_11147 [Trichinella sp. T9]KRX52526.1 hypothetical protein T09_3854 [Trichinella sp. T9]
MSESQNPKCRQADGAGDVDWLVIKNYMQNKIRHYCFAYCRAILYKAPGQASGKIIVSTNAGAWANGAAVLTQQNGHSFGVTLEHVVANNDNIKFLAYNNVPPGMPNVKTKSNSKGMKMNLKTFNIKLSNHFKE